jgi:hypothetical protein
MKIWFGTRYIDTAYFRTWCLNEEFAMVYFIYQPKDAFNGEFSLPLLFSSQEEAKRFYDETWDAIADGSAAVWCLDKEATFCWKLYFKIHSSKIKEKKNKKSNKKTSHEDNNAPRYHQNGTIQGDNAPRKGLFHRILLRLSLRGGRRRGDGVPDSGTDDIQ